MNKILILFITILSISTISANLVISPNLPTIDVEVNKPQNFTMQVQNNYSFDIYNLNFPELEQRGFKIPKTDIPSNTTKTLIIEINTTESYFGQLESKATFSFLVDLPEEIQTYQIQINEFGFNPIYKTIRKGDSVNFKNLDVITHSIYSEAFGTREIQPNSQFTHNFNTLGLFNYYDESFNIYNEFNGIIEVVNRTEEQLAHNPLYDEPFPIILNSVSKPTNLSVTTLNNQFEINYGNSKTGTIVINNLGDIKAETIKITSSINWLIFNKNNFNLNPGDTTGVDYTITPYVTSTNKTNQTYNIILKVKAFNTEEYNINLSVFIPYKEISENIETDFDYAMWLQNNWCPGHPCSAQCSPELPECVSAMNNSDGSNTLTFNSTTQEWSKTQRSLGTITDISTRSYNEQKEFQDSQSKINQDTNQSVSNIREDLNYLIKQKKESRGIWIIIIITLTISVSTILIVWNHNRKQKIKDRIGDLHKYSDEI